jgi:hypothetical protein
MLAHFTEARNRMKKVLYIITLLSVFLAACAPIRSVALGAINAAGRADDGTTVAIYEQGIEVIPVGQKDNVVLSVLGETLQVNDSRCQAVETNEAGLQTTSCFLNTLTSYEVVNVSGTKQSAFLSWLQDGEVVRRFLIVSEINK